MINNKSEKSMETYGIEIECNETGGYITIHSKVLKICIDKKWSGVFNHHMIDMILFTASKLK